MPAGHRDFLMRAMPLLQADPRIAGVAMAGSAAADAMDQFSDLDLVIVSEHGRDESDETGANVTPDRMHIAASLGTLLAAFTGEHVGEPRLLICVYDSPLLHVDLKFVALRDFGPRVDETIVLWERDNRLTAALRNEAAHYPAPDHDWIEQRFWIWLHYAATKIGRGEIFEALDFISWLRGRVLGPLILQHCGAQPNGVRKLEMHAPQWTERLRQTVAQYDARDCVRALRAAVELYQSLRRTPATPSPRSDIERAALQYLSDIEKKLDTP